MSVKLSEKKRKKNLSGEHPGLEPGSSAWESGIYRFPVSTMASGVESAVTLIKRISALSSFYTHVTLHAYIKIIPSGVAQSSNNYII